MSNMLIVYYSWSNGNTRNIAEQLQAATGANLLRIETAEPYAGSYDDVVEQGRREAYSGYTPALQPIAADLSAYDTIVVGTPTWWYTMAPAVLTFLKENDLSGKTVIPFMTNGGWPGHVIKDMTAACMGANVVLPMQIQFDSNGGDHLETPQCEIDAWIASVKALEGRYHHR